MEFVGKIVKKEFTGRGSLSGIVQSYDALSGLFEIVYEDGDSEELDFCEVASLLHHEEAQPADFKHRLGRRPKKRRRIDLLKRENRGDVASGNSNCDSSVVETLVGRSNGNFDLNDEGLVDDLRGGERGNVVDLNEDAKEVLLDLNAGFNLNLNEEFDLNDVDGGGYDGVDRNLKKKNRECIDLNLDANGDVDENSRKELVRSSSSNHLENQKRECGFDLNLGIDEDTKDDEAGGVCEGQANESTSSELVKGEVGLERITNEGGFVASGTLQEVQVKGFDYGEDSKVFVSVDVQAAITVKEDSPEVINDNQGDAPSACKEVTGGRRRRGRRRKVNNTDSLNLTPETPIFTDAKVIYGNQDDIRSLYEEMRHRREKVVDALNLTPDTAVITEAHAVKEDCSLVTDEKQGDTGAAYKEVAGSRRKRRKLSNHAFTSPETTVLRRSTRRGTAKNDVVTTASLTAVNNLSVSPTVSALTEEKPVKSSHQWHEEPVVLPAKVQMPPSSGNLDLVGISVLDFFSVYACLRSFSTLLFLSPFELEEFVVALKCNSPSSLFDCIHVSILQTLKKHLEYLSNEGSESASNCLRSLNWGFLDSITWPVFMVEYFIIHGSDLNPGFNLSHLNLLKNDYYKQPVSIKIEILRCLCDCMIEVETIRSELSRRSSGAESDLDFDRNMNFGALKKRRSGMDVSSGACLMEEAVDDATDWNSDECSLCKMDGSLICCDGCPAAYHSKCVGVANDSLPEGDWFCPECAIDRHKPWMKTRKSLRGAELLGVDAYGRLYFSSCGYLLV